MKNIFKSKVNGVIKKFGLVFILIILITNIFVGFNLNRGIAADETDQAFQGLNNLSDSKTGLLPCDPNAAQDSEEACHPKDAVILGVKLFQIVIYIIIIALLFIIILGGVGYVYNGKNPAYLNKWKKYIKNSMYALLIVVFGIGIVLGILASFGIDSGVLNFVKGLFARLDFNLIPHTYAQTISSITKPSTNGEYTNFFPGLKFVNFFLIIIKIIINYFVAPALVLATIWTGFKFVSAEGNPEKLGKAKKLALRVVIGIISAAAAYTMVTVVLNSLNKVAKDAGVKDTIVGIKSGEACLSGATEEAKKCVEGLTCKGDSGATLTDGATGTCQ